MRRATALVLAVGIVALATSCYQNFDFTGDHLAERWYVDANSDWWDAKTGTMVLDVARGDRPVPADWDGDHFWDKAVVRPNGEWVTGSTLGTITYPAPAQVPAFVSGTGRYYFILPVPGDYDGDGDVEPAWYRDSDATWFVQGMAPVVFGSGPTDPPGTGENGSDMDQDFPIPADYDGDGTTDLATFDPLTREWRVRSSVDGSVSSVVMTRNAGLAFPVPADYDGVGHAQRATSGYEGWDVEGHDLDTFGAIDGNYPAVADYDGDGRADRSSTDDTGIWRTQGTVETFDIVPGSEINTSVFPIQMSRNLMNNIARFTFVGICELDPGYCE